MSYKAPDNPLAKAAGEWVERERTVARGSKKFVLDRLAAFPFERYPDHTCPWHLLRHERTRWDHVAQVIVLIEALRQPTGSHAGKRLVLQPFQIFILLCFLGPEDDEGLRVTREGLLTLARKNGKTAIVAAIVVALMALHPDSHGLLGQEIQVGASDREQAGITYQMASRMVQLDDAIGLEGRFRSVPSRKHLFHRNTLTELKCLSSDAYRAHGGNPAVVLLDEIGNVPHTHAEDFYSVLTTGFGAQTEPLTLMLSTQAPNDQHFFSQQVDRAKLINEGRLEDDTFAGFVFTLPETDAAGEKVDPYDEDLWYLANPGLDTICNRRDLKDWAKRARTLPSMENKFRLLKLNQRVSETSAFLTRSIWEANGGEFDVEALKGRACYLGVDLAEVVDLCALVALFEPEEPGGRHLVVPWFWIPGNDLEERSRRDKVPFSVWAEQGLIDVSSPNTVDLGKVAEKIIECIKLYDVRAVGYDRWRMKNLRAELRKRKYEWRKEERFLIEVGQGFKDSSTAIDATEMLAVEGRLAHNDHPILRWNFANSVVLRDPAGNRKLEKSKSFGRIDGAVATLNAAFARKEIEATDDGPSVYADSERSMIM